MKRSHIIAIVVIAVAIAAIAGSLTETSTYADFAEAYDNPGGSITWWAPSTGPKTLSTTPN